MKRKLTKAEFDELSDDFKKEYKEADGNYLLDIEGGDGALEKALANAKKDKAAAKLRAEEAEAQLAKIDEAKRAAEAENARKKGDFGAIEKSYQEKIAALETAAAEQKAALSAAEGKRLINEAVNAVSDIFISPDIMAPHVERRLSADTVDGVTTVRVLDSEGKPTGDSIADLKKELLAFPDWKGQVKASGASGGGASGSSGSGSARADSSGNIDYLNDDPKKVAAALAPTED